ncbi:hypothetical protein KAU51_05145 [Candidatus Parcubacteria bacterium]|nr:hypothetical protein [Candidatus Parcubacteria bacterium]
MKKEQNKYKPVNIDTNLTGMQFTDSDNYVWKVSSLIHHVKEQKLEVFDLPLCGINLSTSVWEESDLKIKDFAKHLKRTMETNLDYPIILDDDGFIMDGWHRVAKALFLGHSTIKAVRFDKTPTCDYVKAE